MIEKREQKETSEQINNRMNNSLGISKLRFRIKEAKQTTTPKTASIIFVLMPGRNVNSKGKKNKLNSIPQMNIPILFIILCF